MSQYTFNIADYRPEAERGIHTVRSQRKNSGFAVVSSARAMMNERFVEPAVVDIRQVREVERSYRGAAGCGVYQRRGKVLNFRGDSTEIEMLAARAQGFALVERSDSSDLPPAA